MKKIWIFVLIGVAAFVLFSHKGPKLKPVEAEEAAPVVEQVVAPPAPKAEAPAPPVEPPKVTKTPEPPPPIFSAKEKTKPYRADKKGRRLDLPPPKSVRQLLSKLTPYIRPLLPLATPGEAVIGDLDVMASYRGYYELPTGELKRIQLTRTSGGATISLEDANDEYHEWSQRKRELTLKNFDNDPYSLVISIPGDRLFYLKFHAQISLPSGAHPRAMIGWIVPAIRDSAPAARTAMVDYRALTGAVSDADDTRWPPIPAIRRILPDTLPPK